MRLSTSSSGTSPAAILSARPSAMAVLPTPGSPMSTGLFFVRRVKMRSARAISSSRPITGSSLPSRAIAVKSRVNSASVLPLLPSLRLARTSGSGALRITFHVEIPKHMTEQQEQAMIDFQAACEHAGQNVREHLGV